MISFLITLVVVFTVLLVAIGSIVLHFHNKNKPTSEEIYQSRKAQVLAEMSKRNKI